MTARGNTHGNESLMLMLYLGLLTPLLAFPAMMLLARLERCAIEDSATGAAAGSRLGSRPEFASSGGRSSRRPSQVAGSAPARDVTALRAHLTGDRYEGS